jgi:hypothetical protein
MSFELFYYGYIAMVILIAIVIFDDVRLTRRNK